MTLLILMLFIFLIFAYIGGNRKFLSPWFLLCVVTLASFILVIANYKNWQVQINGRFVLYISTALLSFGLATLLVKLSDRERINLNNSLLVENMHYKKRYPENLFVFLSIAFALGYIGKLFIDVGGSSLSFSSALRVIYEIRNNEDYSPGFVYNQMSEIVMGIAYINTFRLFIKINNNKSNINGKDKINSLKLIFPIIIFFVMALISTDRNIFLRYGIYFICLWMFFYYNNCKKKSINFRIMLCVAIAISIISILFFLMGKMKQYSSDFFKSISIYGGSGLYNFNLWIENYNAEPMFGAATFTQFIDTMGLFLKPFGIEIYGSVNRVDPFIQFTSPNGYVYSSNIYTALKPFVEDFGYLGVIIFPFLMGIFYQWLYVKANKSKSGCGWIVYCILIYPVIFFPILEQLFKRFHLGFIYEIGWPMILYFFVLKPKKIIFSNSKIHVLLSKPNAKG